MKLNDCLTKGQIIKIKKSQNQINSLIEMSNLKEEVVNQVVLTQRNISVYFAISYDSLRELLEAICILHEYKVLSHICVGELLKELIPNFNFKFFDKIRNIRNGINYYGTKVDFEQGKEIIKQIFEFKKKLNRIL